MSQENECYPQLDIDITQENSFPLEFRMFDSITGIMYSWKQLLDVDADIQQRFLTVLLNPDSKQNTAYQISQYTGVADRWGKQIFVGDIIRSDKGEIAVVKSSTVNEGQEFHSIYNWGFLVRFTNSPSDSTPSTVEVIDNIYERQYRINAKLEETVKAVKEIESQPKNLNLQFKDFASIFEEADKLKESRY